MTDQDAALRRRQRYTDALKETFLLDDQEAEPLAEVCMAVDREEIAALRQQVEQLLIERGHLDLALDEQHVAKNRAYSRAEQAEERAVRLRGELTKARGRLKRLGYELEQWHAAYGEKALPGTLARLSRAESAVARVRTLGQSLIALAGPEDGGPSSMDLALADAGRRFLAALDEPEARQTTPQGEAP